MRSFREQVEHELLAVQGAEPRQRDHEQRRGRRGRAQAAGQAGLQLRALRVRPAGRARLPGQDRERRLRPRLQRVAGRDPEGGAGRSRIPDVESSKAANAAALGHKIKQKAPPVVIGDRHRAERQRRRRRRGRHVVPARPARLQDADAAEQPRAERAAPGLLPHDDLLRPDAGAVEGGRDRAAGDDAAGRRRSAARGGTQAARARSRIDADGRARHGVPRLARRDDDEAARRSTRPRTSATTRARARTC